MAWGAGVVALWALLRGLRGLLGPDDRPLALGVAVCVIVLAAVLPAARGRDRLRAEQLGARKAVQFFGAAGALLLAVYLGAGVVVAAALGAVAAALVPLAWPPPRGRTSADRRG